MRGLRVVLDGDEMSFTDDKYRWEVHYGIDGHLTEVTVVSLDGRRKVRFWKPAYAIEEDADG